MYFSKSKYKNFCQCSKIIWLDKNKPEEKKEDESSRKRMEDGHKIGEIAQKLFGCYKDVTTLRNNKLDLNEMERKTNECIKNGVENICEASFDYNGLYCAVDILHKENGGYAIYEVKSSTKLEDYYYDDVAYQKYVLKNCNINVTGTYVVFVNKDYEKQGELNLKNFFKIFNVKDKIDDRYKIIEQNLISAEKILNLNTEPKIDIGNYCHHPHTCPYYKYCSKNLPNNNVLQLYNSRKKWEFYKDNIVSFDDLQESGKLNSLTKIQKIQVDHALNNKGTQINKEIIKKFLSNISYPLYFLDFETINEAIPLFNGAKPYEQIPCQYSLHYIESEIDFNRYMKGEKDMLKHKEFLKIPDEDPRRALAESLCKDIPQNVCVLVYNKNFECGILKRLAEKFPDLSNHLLNIEQNVKDLCEPFKKGAYYNKAMGGSFSIKSVLPAIFPNDPELDYNKLKGVHNGEEASSIFPKIKEMSPKDYKKTCDSLLKYCELDTFAMVKILQELIKVV